MNTENLRRLRSEAEAILKRNPGVLDGLHPAERDAINILLREKRELNTRRRASASLPANNHNDSQG